MFASFLAILSVVGNTIIIVWNVALADLQPVKKAAVAAKEESSDDEDEDDDEDEEEEVPNMPHPPLLHSFLMSWIWCKQW